MPLKQGSDMKMQMKHMWGVGGCSQCVLTVTGTSPWEIGKKNIYWPDCSAVIIRHSFIWGSLHPPPACLEGKRESTAPSASLHPQHHICTAAGGKGCQLSPGTCNNRRTYRQFQTTASCSAKGYTPEHFSQFQTTWPPSLTEIYSLLHESTKAFKATSPALMTAEICIMNNNTACQKPC